MLDNIFSFVYKDKLVVQKTWLIANIIISYKEGKNCSSIQEVQGKILHFSATEKF